METLRVRVYNVRFGDAVLITVPDRDDGTTTMRHILVDLGNVLRGREGNGGEDAVFGPVIEDIRKVLDGKPLDLYVMTHEHMDHVQGLLFASEKLQQELDVAHAWLTASAEKGYYQKPGHEKARRKKLDLDRAYRDAARYLAAAPEDADALGPFMFNNNSSNTGKCVEFLRNLADETTYVHREADLDGTHPFSEAKLELWAPEEDTSVYYGHFRPVALGVTSGGANGTPMLEVPKPPRGVDSGAFYGLVTSRRRGVYDNLLQIDRAANNSSVVFSLEWRGYRLLFPGDAEHRSWKEMDKRGLLKPVHFLKVSHHGSWNGTPTGELLDKILPLPPPDDRKRYAAISTWEKTYNNVPDTETRNELAKRCRVRSVEDARDKLYFDVKFRAKPADG